MTSRHHCISSVATVVVITVCIISNAGASPPVSSTVTQKLQELSDAIHELTKAVGDQQSCKSIQNIAEALQSHQTIMNQVLSKSVDATPQCQTVNYELAVSIGEVKAKFEHVSQAVEAAVDRVAYLEDRLQKVETIASHGLEASPDLKDKLRNQSQALETAVKSVAYLEDKLQNQSHAMQESVMKVVHFDQRLQELQTIASQTQEASRDIREKFQTHVAEEEASSKGSCRSPFYQVGDDCLFVDHAHKMTWENARRFCRAFGGDLAVPSDVFELRKFITMFGDVHFWIGGSDLLMEGDWRWLNGSKVDLSVGWKSGEPNNSGGEHCLHYYGPSDWLLNDHKCSQLMHFVCQDAIYAQ